MNLLESNLENTESDICREGNASFGKLSGETRKSVRVLERRRNVTSTKSPKAESSDDESNTSFLRINDTKQKSSRLKSKFATPGTTESSSDSSDCETTSEQPETSNPTEAIGSGLRREYYGTDVYRSSHRLYERQRYRRYNSALNFILSRIPGNAHHMTRGNQIVRALAYGLEAEARIREVAEREGIELPEHCQLLTAARSRLEGITSEVIGDDAVSQSSKRRLALYNNSGARLPESPAITREIADTLQKSLKVLRLPFAEPSVPELFRTPPYVRILEEHETTDSRKFSAFIRHWGFEFTDSPPPKENDSAGHDTSELFKNGRNHRAFFRRFPTSSGNMDSDDIELPLDDVDVDFESAGATKSPLPGKAIRTMLPPLSRKSISTVPTEVATSTLPNAKKILIYKDDQGVIHSSVLTSDTQDQPNQVVDDTEKVVVSPSINSQDNNDNGDNNRALYTDKSTSLMLKTVESQDQSTDRRNISDENTTTTPRKATIIGTSLLTNRIIRIKTSNGNVLPIGKIKEGKEVLENRVSSGSDDVVTSNATNKVKAAALTPVKHIIVKAVKPNGPAGVDAQHGAPKPSSSVVLPWLRRPVAMATTLRTSGEKTSSSPRVIRITPADLVNNESKRKRSFCDTSTAPNSVLSSPKKLIVRASAIAQATTTRLPTQNCNEPLQQNGPSVLCTSPKNALSIVPRPVVKVTPLGVSKPESKDEPFLLRGGVRIVTSAGSRLSGKDVNNTAAGIHVVVSKRPSHADDNVEKTATTAKLLKLSLNPAAAASATSDARVIAPSSNKPVIVKIVCDKKPSGCSTLIGTPSSQHLSTASPNSPNVKNSPEAKSRDVTNSKGQFVDNANNIADNNSDSRSIPLSSPVKSEKVLVCKSITLRDAATGHVRSVRPVMCQPRSSLSSSASSDNKRLSSSDKCSSSSGDIKCSSSSDNINKCSTRTKNVIIVHCRTSRGTWTGDGGPASRTTRLAAKMLGSEISATIGGPTRPLRRNVRVHSVQMVSRATQHPWQTISLPVLRSAGGTIKTDHNLHRSSDGISDNKRRFTTNNNSSSQDGDNNYNDVVEELTLEPDIEEMSLEPEVDLVPVQQQSTGAGLPVPVPPVSKPKSRLPSVGNKRRKFSTTATLPLQLSSLEKGIMTKHPNKSTTEVPPTVVVNQRIKEEPVSPFPEIFDEVDVAPQPLYTEISTGVGSEKVYLELKQEPKDNE